MVATVLVSEAGVRAAVGSNLGHSEWLEITHDRLALFEQATGDNASTYLSISLSNMFLPQIVEVQGFAMGINYGTDAVRFPVPIAAGMRVRGSASLLDVVEVRGGVQTRMLITIEQVRGEPLCVIESISRWLH